MTDPLIVATLAGVIAATLYVVVAGTAWIVRVVAARRWNRAPAGWRRVGTAMLATGPSRRIAK
jgi:hypothetical protein